MKAGMAMAAVLVMLTAGAASADDELPHQDPPRLRRGSEILLRAEGTQTRQSWIDSQLDHVRTHKRGFAYSREFSFGSREMEMRLVGPALRHNRYGLTFEVRF